MLSLNSLNPETAARRAVQEMKELAGERDEARQQAAQVGERLSAVRGEQKAIVDARNKHEKRCVCRCWIATFYMVIRYVLRCNLYVYSLLDGVAGQLQPLSGSRMSCAFGSAH